MANSNGESWSLEVVRGADVGRRFALAGGTVVLGNALDGLPGVDLSAQETNSPRKMAGRQAQIHVSNGSLSLRDLGSPGGTFVDRRRVPPHSDLPLKEGDVIQLGGIQLKVARGGAPAPRVTPPPATSSPSAPPPPPSPGAAFNFSLKAGGSCRSWDDFLTISAQRWADLRDELTSGRLAGFLTSIGRNDLAPDPRAPGSPDERLDAWLGRLPATRPATPELDVHPKVVTIRATAGGVVRKKVQVSNSGYRLLRSSAKVATPGANWLSLAPEFAGREFVTIEATDLAFDAAVPEQVTAPMVADLLIAGNGGEARITVRIEPKVDIGEPNAQAAAPVGKIAMPDMRGQIAGQSARFRMIAWPVAAMAGRLIASLTDWALPGADASGSLRLVGPAAAIGLVGAALGTLRASRGGEARDVPFGAIGGAVIGAMTAAVVVAVSRTLEAPLGTLPLPQWITAIATWGLAGLGLAFASLALAPPANPPATETKP